MKRIVVFFFLFSSLSFGIELQPGKEFFTIQVASFKQVSKARKVLERLKGLPYTRVSYQHGRYRVRVGFFNSVSDAERFAEKELKGRVNGYYITKTRWLPEGKWKKQSSVERETCNSNQNSKLTGSVSDSNVNLSNSTQAPSRICNEEDRERKLPREMVGGYRSSLKTQKKLENVGLSSKKSSNQRQNLEVTKNKEKSVSVKAGNSGVSGANFSKLEHSGKAKRKSYRIAKYVSVFTLFLFGVLLTLFTFFALRKKKRSSGRYLEELIAELLEEERCGELLETVLPALSSQPDNTFLRKAAADCYVKSGKFLEAASLYEEIAEILNRKGLSVLAGEFKERADELYGKEFKGRE